MRYKTVKEILDRAAALHDRLAAYSREAAQGQDKQRLGLVLEYLADHQDRLGQAIESFEDDAGDRVMSTWFDRSPELDLPEVQPQELADIDEVEALIDKVVEFHDRIIALYGNLRDQARVHQVREVFSSLADLERHEKMELIQSTRQLQDI
ncbi:MAG: hypothetical protein EA418_10735 [Wenzhouxiangellaceae bacterium]|nr:MAG: hypothetical protein EA418_10735 [Wenzhouxiangellaceae bacterium]